MYDQNEQVTCSFCKNVGPKKLFQESFVPYKNERHYACGRCLGGQEHEKNLWLPRIWQSVAEMYPKGAERFSGRELRDLIRRGFIALCAPHEAPVD